MNKNNRSKKTKFIFILSQRYSGSTLLSYLLATHPEVSSIGERRKFYNKSIMSDAFSHHRAKICSCGELFTNCNFYNELKSRVLSKVNPKKLNTNFTEFNIFKNKHLNLFVYKIMAKAMILKLPMHFFPFNGKLKQMYDFNNLLVNEILDMEQTSVFVDSSKSIKHVLFLSQIKELDLRIVWLKRDPRAQVNSALKYNKTWNTQQATNYWKSEMLENQRILETTKLKHISLTYEALCRSTKKELQRLADFFEMENLFSLEFKKDTRHIIGNGNMRLGKQTTIAERREWENELTENQIKLIESLTTEYRSLYSMKAVV